GGAVSRRVRVAFLPGDGGDVHDPPVVVRAHVGDDGAAAEKHAGQVHVDRLAPDVGGILPHRGGRAGHACVGDEDVDAAEASVDLACGGVDLRLVRHVD